MALTTEQQSAWTSDGYLVLKGVLSPNRVRTLKREIDRLHRRVSRHSDGKKGMDVRNILPESQVFIDLIDPKETFGLVLDLVGPYIQLSMAQALVRTPDRKGSGYVHADGGQAMTRIRVTETSLPLQIKLQYFLTDVRGKDRGNFALFPGSQLRPFPNGGGRISPDTPGVVQLEAKAGDVAIFPHALWHGVAPNRGNRARKSLIYCYSQMCFRPFDFDEHSDKTLDRCTPRQRRLLGDLGADWRPGAYFYGPKDQVKVMGAK
jgi:ectoine hydroxylase-related dioxygenase (phytanoyl-CoA dioxygenase family)